MPIYSLQTILSTFTNKNGKKLTIFNAGPVGGMSSKFVKFFFFSLPFIEYMVIFNPYIFNKLGLVTAIVTYIVFMSIIMMIIFLVTLKVKSNVVQKIADSWKFYFPDVDLKMVLATGITPYSKFFDYYTQIIKEEVSDDNVYSKLKSAFLEMQNDNKELLIAIKNDN